MFGLYITHPQVKIDPAIAVPRWGLSDIGRARTLTTAGRGWVTSLRRIVSSEETKAIETANVLGKAAGVTPEIVANMHENDRTATGFLPPDVFEAAADQFFAAPLESHRGWERAADAQARIVSAVGTVLDHHDPRLPIAFVGHGAVGTLLKCALSARPIARSQDQPGGGGNLFAFDLAERRLACDWTAMEDWKGWDG